MKQMNTADDDSSNDGGGDVDNDEMRSTRTRVPVGVSRSSDAIIEIVREAEEQIEANEVEMVDFSKKLQPHLFHHNHHEQHKHNHGLGHHHKQDEEGEEEVVVVDIEDGHLQHGLSAPNVLMTTSSVTTRVYYSQ